MPVRRFQVVLEWDAEDSLWVSHVPSLNHLSTYGETREEALAETKDAILGYLEAAEKEQIDVPESQGSVELVEVEIGIA
jgi:predicted RNase H-like HicB family nuclease